MIWKPLRELRSLAKQRGWELDDGQKRRIAEVGLRWEELRRVKGGDVGGKEKEDGRKKLLEIVWRDLEEVLSKGEGRREGDGEMVERFAAMVLLGREGVRGEEEEEVRRAAEMFQWGCQLRQEEERTINPLPNTADPTLQPHPESSAFASQFLSPLFTLSPSLAIQHLHSMLDTRRLPTRSTLQSILRAVTNEEEEARYVRARDVLDAACTGGGIKTSVGLEELLKERLEAAERSQEIEERPMGAFLRWVAEKGEGEEGLLLGLRMWEEVYGKGEWQRVKSWESIKSLELLVDRACPKRDYKVVARTSPQGIKSNNKIKDDQQRQVPPPLPAVLKAVSLATDHLPRPILVARGIRLLHAIASLPSSSVLSLYLTLRHVGPLTSPDPFQWHAALLGPFTSLLLNTKDPALVVQLYLDWTAAGMTFPVGLWKPLWRALGARGDVDELSRVIDDFEETGRGVVGGRIIAYVIQGSTEGPHYLRSLKLLAWFRRRREKAIGQRRGQRSGTPSDVVDVPLCAWNNVLEQLARTRLDRREDVMRLMKLMEEDGVRPDLRSWNAVLESQVLRRGGGGGGGGTSFGKEGLDQVGASYNALVRAGWGPDRRTMSLVLEGFVRLAMESTTTTETTAESKWRKVGIEGGLRTFETAMRVGVGVRGQQVAGLMRVLGREGRWEEAKEVGEKWWRDVVRRGKKGGGVEEREGTFVRLAGEDLERWEERGGAVGEEVATEERDEEWEFGSRIEEEDEEDDD